MNRWRRPAMNALFFVAGVLALGMVQGILDPANEKADMAIEEAAGRAIAARESIPPETWASLQRLTHPMQEATYVDHHYIGECPKRARHREKGCPKRERRYTPHGDLTGELAHPRP